MHGLIGRKIGMSQVFAENGDAVPVTVIEAGPCYVTQVKTLECDGYEAAQIGFEAKKEKQTTRPLQGHFKKAKVEPQRIVREVAVQDIEACEPGQVVGADIFETGELVDVTGYFKGRGFQGVVKRHGFKGGDKTRGQSDRWRHPGSIGQSATPSKVFKGTRMGGRMGNKRVTVRNLQVVGVDAEKNILLVKGAVPGHRNGYVLINRAG
ncbi:MAG: 50S ribosomal protein L3 [Gemmatimonadetes bacterium]|nr:50S ribosomal protein L3 [Gemmatimonadota bacterium]MYD27073.1 50S ribosomal protein L3 [Gemmatimonadota bacterium]MYI98255.1 50S ribosomal protein L3 [Gemmatimonadota bacterium]